MSRNAIRSAGAGIPWTFARIVSLAATLGALALFLWIAVAAAGVLLLSMLGVLFAVMQDGAVRLLRAHVAMPRWVVLVLLWLVLAMALAGGVLLLAPRVVAEMDALSQRIPQALSQIESSVENSRWGRRAVDELTELRQSGTLQETVQSFLGFFSSVLGTVGGILLAVVLSMFIAIEPHTYIDGALRLLPPGARPRAADIAAATGRALRWWLLGRFVTMAIVFALTWIGLMLLGLPLAFLLALVVGLFSFVPTVGPLAASVPALLVGLSAGPQQLLAVVLLYLGVHLLEGYAVTPVVQRRAVRLPPALLLVAQLVMGVLAGVLGVLLATPILVVLIVVAGMLYVEDKLGEDVDLP